VEKPKKPENLIARNKMVDILLDVFIINAAKGTEKKTLENNNVTPDDYIYKKYQIDSFQFAKSNEYYAYDIKVYESIINEVESKLNAKKIRYQEEIDLEEERIAKRLDSIKKIGDSLKPRKTSKILKRD
jgi:hypothetical protein